MLIYGTVFLANELNIIVVLSVKCEVDALCITQINGINMLYHGKSASNWFKLFVQEELDLRLLKRAMYFS